MQVTFRQSGGAAGFVRGVDLDTSALESSIAERLERLVRASGIEGEIERVSERARDLRQYEIVIRREGSVASLVCDDGTLPSSARPLIRFLDARAEPIAP